MTIAPEQLQEVIEPVEPLLAPLPAALEEPPAAEPLNVRAVAMAGAFASTAAAWLGGALIRGLAPRAIAVLGVVIGAGVSYSAIRFRRVRLQYAALPIAGIVGAILVTPAAKGGTANLFGLISEAIHGGGLLQPPIPFTPGWRFLLVALFAVVSTAAVALPIALSKPKLAVIVPLPVFIGAALLQPQHQAVSGSIVGTCFLIGGLALALGAGATRDDVRELSRAFELRRLIRGGVMLIIVMVAITLLARTSVLFPAEQRHRVIPPRRPPNLPMEADHALFEVHANMPGPFRVGVLDQYDGQAWLLPSADPSRLRPLNSGGGLPSSDMPPSLSALVPSLVELRIVDMSGIYLPVPAEMLSLHAQGQSVSYDPETTVPQLDNRLPQGLKYSVRFAAVPFASELNDAPAPSSSIVSTYTRAPDPPPSVIQLLQKAPKPRFTRLQYLREALYSNVTLAGGGGSVPVTPSRVAAMFAPHAQATPFEVAAAEALLARWAGVPARLAYGFFGGDPIKDGLVFHPKHGRVWLEAYFAGYGWIPLVGVPPKAATSLSQNAKLQNRNVQPSGDLALVIFVPVREPSFRLLFEIVRYWFSIALLVALGLVMLGLAYPVALKARRSARRRRWGIAHGAVGRALVSYTEFRDRCQDLNLGNLVDTPVSFVERFESDEEHDELAWLVTRIFWGDLRRDLRDEDVSAEEEMIASVQKRIFAAQPAANRFLSRISRASLRDPYNTAVPNLYPRPVLRLRALAAHTKRFLRFPRRVRRVAVHATALALLLTSCAGGAQSAEAPTTFPPNVPPTAITDVSFVHEPVAERRFVQSQSLVSSGRVYTIHTANSTSGALEVAVLERNVDARDEKVQRQIAAGIGGAFKPYRLGTVRLLRQVRHDERIYLWFPPERNAMVVILLKNTFSQPDGFVSQVVATLRQIDPRRLVLAAEG